MNTNLKDRNISYTYALGEEYFKYHKYLKALGLECTWYVGEQKIVQIDQCKNSRG